MFSVLLAVAVLWPDAPISEELSSTEHSGVFVSLFETILFEPCDSNERWWLDAPGDINKNFMIECVTSMPKLNPKQGKA